MPCKQRHTAQRVFDRLRDECGFTGGYTIIKDYMREREQGRQEVFVPPAHPPGHVQGDFGEAMVMIDGVERKARFFVLDLQHSDGCYVRAYPAAVSEARVDGHIQAFAFFGAVPQSVVYDNDRCLVAKILPNLSVWRAVQYLKCAGSHKLLSGFKRLRKRYWSQHLRARGYWVCSGGNIIDEMWKKYIQNQKPPEPDDDFQVV